MRTLALDGRTGASGDMLLGALLDAGADPDALAPAADVLPVTYRVEQVDRQGIAATSVTVVHDDAGRSHPAGRDYHSSHDDDAHEHDGAHEHDDHAHAGPDGAEGHGPDRTYPEVRRLVADLGLPAGVTDDALGVFERLARGESAVHGTDLGATTFHEVGADDAVADVVGVALLLADLDVDRVVTAPVATGGGEVTFSHGTYPVPTPAVTEIVAGADFDVVGGPVDTELLTPTGAALLAHFATGVDSLPAMDVDATGYGAGDRELPGRPNVLRTLVGTTTGALDREPITVLETNVDDVSPEVLGDLHESLAAVGALDVSVVPLGMKKSRPGHLVRVVVPPADAERVARRLAVETGTLGVRDAGATHRWTARREKRTVAVDVDGRDREVSVKVARDADGVLLDVSAEYDDAAAVARETDRPVRWVMARAETAARQSLADAPGGADADA